MYWPTSAGRPEVSVNPWKTTSSRVAYKNNWVRVREDEVIRPDGTPGLYGVIEIRPSVGVVAMNHLDEVVLVGQWRYPLNRYSWEIPRGGSQPGETDMLAAAQRELAEESGVMAENWQLIGQVDVCNGVSDDVQSLFWARNLSATEMKLDPEEDISVAWKPFPEALEMAMTGKITEVCSVAALLKVALLRQKQ
jgi:8-oxo-dGTP pyrophosphatase MutT (NUDIX family)